MPWRFGSVGRRLGPDATEPRQQGCLPRGAVADHCSAGRTRRFERRLTLHRAEAMTPSRSTTMTPLSPNAQLVSTIFEQVAQGNGAPFWDACHDDIVWRTIGSGSWSGEFVGKQTIVDEIFRPLNRALAERSTIPGRLIDGGDVIVLQARGKNLTRDGQRYDNDYAFVIHFRDGKIARYEEYCDTDLIARVLPDRIAAKSKS